MTAIAVTSDDGRRHHRRLVATIAAVAALTALFGWRQNHGAVVGGPISTAKTLWLGYAIVMFYVVPIFLWRDTALDARVRRLFAWVTASFLARGVLELWIIYFTRGWRCEYGIAHDAFTLLLVLMLRPSAGSVREARSRHALAFATLLQITLVVEAFMAWSFSRLASPAEGIYFAADTAHFTFVNRASWIAVAIGGPLVGLLVARLAQASPRAPAPR